MKTSQITALAVIAVLLWCCAVPALAEEEKEETTTATENNIRYYYGRGSNPFGSSSFEEEEEVFFFGESAQDDAVEFKFDRFQDTTGRASRDMKRIIGVTLVTTAVTMVGWAIFLNTERVRTDNWHKVYEGTGVVPTTREHRVNVPTVVAGICLGGGGVWLMRRK
jgi:hypothetical protein